MNEVMKETIHLPVMEHFYTLQGEGFHQGKAAYFIRLGGCDVGCVWCDVKDSWDAAKHPLLNIDDLIFNMEETIKKKTTNSSFSTLNSKPLTLNSPIVVITGGEPL